MPVLSDTRGDGGVEIGGEGLFSFTHGSAQVDNDLVVEVDWDNDGDFDESEENVTGYVMASGSVTGRDYPSQVNGKASPGRGTAMVLNTDNRFNFFNAGSPLNTVPFSLASGRTFRIRTSASAPVDPVALARDRFNGAGALGADELANTWTDEVGTWTRLGDGTATATPAADSPIATVDVGTDDCYIQLTSASDSATGIVYRFDDPDNYGLLFLDSFGEVSHYTRVAGVDTLHETYLMPWFWAPATIGILVAGSQITGYVEGAPVFTGATAQSSSSTVVGITINDTDAAVSDFAVWDTVPTETEGVLWTGDVSSVEASAPSEGVKTATISAEGRLAGANTQVEVSPHIFGAPTGIQVGSVLAAAGLLHPPGPIDEGDITTGAVAFERAQALELARRLEETEVGFLQETQEGPVGYDARSARSGLTPVAWWSDAEGAQFSYKNFDLQDHRRDITNRVLAGLAPRSAAWPPDEDTDFASTAGGVANDVTVTMPSPVAEGDLLLVIIASTVVVANRQWLVPHGWRQLINESDSLRIRVYAKRALGNEDGTNVTFFDDSAGGGLWIARIVQVPAGQWFGSVDGIEQAPCVVADAAAGDDTALAHTPPALTVPWGREPTLFVAARAGIGSFAGADGGVGQAPPGYLSINVSNIDGAANQFDTSLHTAMRLAATATEAPGPFGSEDFVDYLVVCSTLIAVRGWNGDPPLASGHQTVQVDNVTSQDRHGMVRTLPTVPDLFASTDDAEAYAERIAALYGDDRPVITLTFVASTNAAYRAQAIRRRVGHLIHVTANDTGPTGTGMGIDGDFFIENIAHRWPDEKTWIVTWQLSPT